ncbi:MAG: M28 family peptidase [Dehalococcoidia bacterium]|nr:M28 family peptidase [Dehalococcoidia bacterium]
MDKALEAPEITLENIRDTFAFTDEVVEQYPGRVAGSEAVHKAGRRVKEEFEKCCDPGTVKIEEFEVHPKSFLKYIPGLVVMYFLCMTLLYFGCAWIAFAGMALALGVFAAQFVFYRHLLDPLFPREKGYNTYGFIEPEGEVKQQVIVSGHHDAAYAFQILAHMPKLYFPLMLAGVGLLVIGTLLALTAAVMSLFGIHLPQWVALVFIVLGVFEIPYLFFTTGEVVPGAGDNMIAVAIAAEIGKVFGGAKKEGNNLLKHTRLGVLSVDAEEAGLRGARAYVKRHRAELLKTKTYVFNIDTLYHLDSISFFEADLNSTVKLSSEMANECADIARTLGYQAAVSRMGPGGGSTDAAAFGEAGIEATNLAAMSFQVKDYDKGWVYHTPQDTSKYIEPSVVEAALRIIIQYILKKDAAKAL